MKVQSLCSQLGKTGCLAFCYARIATDGYGGCELDRDIHLIKSLAHAQKLNLLAKDFTVLNAEKLIHFVNPLVKAIVTKKKISSLNEIKTHEYCCVNFVNGSANHWVWVKYGRVFYNSLDTSLCVEKGNPVDARIIKIIEA